MCLGVDKKVPKQLVDNFTLRNNSLTKISFLLKLTSTEHFTVWIN